MKKPTLAQLKKRPALWWDEGCNVFRISFTNGRSEYLDMTADYEPLWRESGFLSAQYVPVSEFLGWL